MTIQKVIDILEFYNMWWRGYDIEQPNPRDIGIVIDITVKELRNNLSNKEEK